MFAAELAGTFALVALAAGSVVADARHGGLFGPALVALAPAVGAAAGVYMFARVSMAHLNPAVTLGMWMLGYVGGREAGLYAAAQAAGALLAALFVLVAVGSEASAGANLPGPHPLPLLMLAEASAAASLMLVVALVARTGGLRGMGGLAIGAAVGVNVALLGGFSGASMNPARSLGPSAVSGSLDHLWMYVFSSCAGAAAAAACVRARGKVNSLRSGAAGR